VRACWLCMHREREKSIRAHVREEEKLEKSRRKYAKMRRKRTTFCLSGSPSLSTHALSLSAGRCCTHAQHAHTHVHVCAFVLFTQAQLIPANTPHSVSFSQVAYSDFLKALDSGRVSEVRVDVEHLYYKVGDEKFSTQQLTAPPELVK